MPLTLDVITVKAIRRMRQAVMFSDSLEVQEPKGLLLYVSVGPTDVLPHQHSVAHEFLPKSPSKLFP